MHLREDLILPEGIRKKLKSPLGALIERPDEEELKRLAKEPFATVGDKVTESFCSLGLKPKLEIVDGREMREKRPPPDGCYQLLVRVRNPPGRITAEALKAVKEALKTDIRVRILVEGEEDLLTLPCILYAPDGMRVFYGQPGVGIVYVDVGRESREKIRKIMEEMGLKVYK